MRESTRRDYEARIQRVARFIEEHLDAPADLDELAAVASFSPFHFARIFRGMTGESPAAYLRRLRLERAAMELTYTERAVTRIALDAGYESHEAFTRAFRRRFDVPPASYREDRGAAMKALSAQLGVGGLSLPQQEDQTMEVDCRTLPPRRVAYVRHVGPYHECKAAWEKLCSRPEVLRHFGPNTTVIGICYDDPDVTDRDKIRYDACVEVDERFAAVGGVEVQELAGGEYAVYLHVGPYEEFHDTYRRLYGEWLPSSGREVRAAPSLEIYLNSPQDTAPAELRTEICVPLA